MKFGPAVQEMSFKEKGYEQQTKIVCVCVWGGGGGGGGLKD